MALAPTRTQWMSLDVGRPCRSSTVYWFVRKFYHRREPLWISTRAEVEAFVGVMILMESDWVRKWLLGVLASDASLSGYGVAHSFWNPSGVATVGRVAEVRRWRCGSMLASRHTLQKAGFSCRFV